MLSGGLRGQARRTAARRPSAYPLAACRLAARLLLLAVIFCALPLHSARASDAPSPGTAPAPHTAPHAATAPYLADGGEPALERMLGAMLMCGFRGAELTPGDAFLDAVARGRIGGVILFDRDVPTGGERNIRSPEQVRRLTGVLRSAAPGPLFIAVDQEGGQVRRLKPQRGFLDLPSAQRLGQGSVSATRETADALGRELAGLGINVDLAPVADVDVNPLNPAIGRLGRAFSTDPLQVAAHALAFGQGLAAAGVTPVLKHFPGQGCAREDSHHALPDISQCWDGSVDLLPYAEIFRAGWPGMVMMGHLFHAGLDPHYPATLSRTAVTGLLRQGLGWQGVIISDDMQMKAISGRYGLKEAILLAVRAGVDILLFGNNLEWMPDLPDQAFAALRALVDEGRLSPERIRQSWLRISALHARSGQQTTLPRSP